jgi:septal ring factor EnvC (AmiA/AmiB activator)
MLKFLLSLIFICSTSFIWSQSSQQEKLEERKAQIQREIRDNEVMLQTVKKKEKSALSVIIIQQNKIRLKENLIHTTEKQTKLLNNDMYSNQVKINKLKKELNVLKADYSKMILKSYKNRSEQSRAMFILSSENFLQAYKRAQYMRQYTNYRKAQGDEIDSKSTKLIDYNGKLSAQKVVKQKLIVENEKERSSLLIEKKEQEKVVNSIKKDKNKIDRLIREAIAEANRKAAAERAKKNPNEPESKSSSASSSRIILTAEAKILADNFRANKGKLPWPVEKGFVSLRYGDQPHPQFHTLMIHNSGVEITTEQGSNARAVYSGEVTSVIILSPVNKAVMIQHGDYFTVYQNLSSVFVSKGDKVNIKQEIGKIRTSGETGRTVLKFTISQNTTYNNPSSWLYNM